MIVVGVESGRAIFFEGKNPERYTPSDTTLKTIYFAIQAVIGLYFLLYTTGILTYFGMGLQLYLITPFFRRKIFQKQIYLLLLNLLTGKRSTLIILSGQLSAIVRNRVKFQKFRFILILLFLISLMFIIKQNTSLLNRFDVFNEFSDVALTDIESDDTLYALSMMSGGRSQEIFSFFSSDLITLENLLIGAPSTSSFTFYNNLNGDEFKHHYFHLSPINYLKHFGIPFTLMMLVTQGIVFSKLFMNYYKLDLISSLFLGYFIAMFFGAIVVVDVVFWFSFGYGLEFYKRIK